MRLLIASMAALAAVAFAAPSFAQDDGAAPVAPVPTTKPKAGTAAYCQTLKSASSRSSCLKKVSAKAVPKGTATAKKTKKPSAPKQPDVGQLSTPGGEAATMTAPAPSSAGSVAVPPLPQKTI